MSPLTAGAWKGLNEEIFKAGTERVDFRCCYFCLLIYVWIMSPPTRVEALRVQGS